MAAESKTKKLRPDEVSALTNKHKDVDPYSHITSLQHVVTFTDIDFPIASEDVIATQFIKYIKRIQPILSSTLYEYDSKNGALNPESTHRLPSLVATKLDASGVRRLNQLRTAFREHLFLSYYSLSASPPLSGGDTSRWSIALQMWIIVALLTCILLRCSDERKSYDTFNPNTSRYLTSNALVVEPTLRVCEYSMRTLQLSVHNLLRRLCALTSYTEELDVYLAMLEKRTAELICGGGALDGHYDAAEWCAPIALAHTAVAQNIPPDPKLITATTDFIAHSMVWFFTLNSHVQNYHQMAPPPSFSATAPSIRFSIEQGRALRWYPKKELCYIVLEFLCEYAANCKDDTYMHGMRDFQTQFESSPDHPALHRMKQNTHMAVPAEVMGENWPNMSPIGKEYVRFIKYGVPLLVWLHRFWNWRYGETRVRSAYLGTNKFHADLALLHIVNLYLAAQTRIWFKHRFVIYQK